MSNLVIELLDERTIGRNFQVAALGLIRSSLPSNIVDAIKNGLVDGKIVISSNDLKVLLETLAQYMKDVCESKRVLPELVNEALSYIGIQISSNDYSNKNLCNNLVNAVETVLNNPQSKLGIPRAFRTYVFGKYRTSLEEVRSETSNIASLYIATAGAIISMVDRLRVKETYIELYIVPDGSITSFNEAVKVYGLIYASRDETLDKFIENIYNNLENVSLEISLILATMAFTYYVATQVKKLQSLDQYYGSFETYRLISIRPEKIWGKLSRMQVAWERPLTISEHLRMLQNRNAINMLDNFIRLASYVRRVRNDVNAYDDTISNCLHEVYGYMETGSLDLLTSCAGRITRIVDTLNSKNICWKNKYICTDLESLLRYLMRLSY